MATELIPVVDLGLLSQAELNTLADSCPNAFDLRRCDDVVVPKIDRSVFNESAGSRKQTYSRLRLAPHKPSASPSSSSSSGAGAAASAAGQRPRGVLPSHSAAGDGGDEDETGRRENQQIVAHLRRLFAQEDPSFSSPPAATDPPQTLALDPPTHAPAGRNLDAVSNGSTAHKSKTESLALDPVQDRDREVLNPKGVAVDLVALGEKVDPFGDELRRRTEGLSKEDELLGFLNGLDGQWGSRRRRRKIVDASALGDHLPKGWTLLLGLKRKEGVAWVNCRRYVSPNGHQFVTCKEASSYILSLVGQPNSLIQVSVENGKATGLAGSTAAGVYQQNGAAKENQTLPSTFSLSIDHEKQVSLYLGERKAAEELGKGYVCSECKLTFIDKELHMEHRLRCQGTSAKRRRLHKSIGEGVIVKDGKYECQFCHKTFNERQRYNGHIGAHVRYQGLSAEALSDEPSTQRIITPSPLSVACSDPNLPEESERAVISTHNCVQTIENCEVDKTEILGVSRTDKSFDNQKSLEIADKSGEIPHVGDQIICQDVMDNKSKEILQSTNVTDKESNGCAAISSMLHSNVSTIAVHKLAGVSQEGPTGKSADIQVVGGDVDFNKYEDVAKISNIEDMKPLDSRNTDFDIVDLKSEEVDGARSQEEIKLNPRSDSSYPLASKDNEIWKDGAEAAQLSSFTLCPDAIGNDSDKNDFRSQDSVESNDTMVFQPNICINYMSPSVMDVDTEKTDSVLDLPASSMIPELGNYGREQSGALESHLIALSGDGPCYDTDKYSTDIFTSNIAGNILVGMDIPVAELKTDLANCHELLEKDTVSKQTAAGTLDVSCSSNPCFNGQTSAIEPNAGCTFDIDAKESIFQGLDKPDSELENRFNSSNAGYEEVAASATTGINGERNYLQFNLTGLSSWTYSADGIPIVNMITPQCEDYLGGIGEKQENLPGVEELRLGPPEPFDFLNLTTQSSLPIAESTQVFGYPTQAENGSCPSLELGWDISLPKVVGGYPYASVCVWCGREFSHGGVNPEQQSDTLGFICPACKERISGHLNVLQNGSSTLR